MSAFRLYNLGLLLSEHSISCGPISKREIGKLGAILDKTHLRQNGDLGPFLHIEIWIIRLSAVVRANEHAIP